MEDVLVADQAIQKAEEVKQRLKGMMRRIEFVIEVTEKQVKRTLAIQLARARGLLQEQNEKCEERRAVVRSVSEVYERIQKLFIVN